MKITIFEAIMNALKASSEIQNYATGLGSSGFHYFYGLRNIEDMKSSDFPFISLLPSYEQYDYGNHANFQMPARMTQWEIIVYGGITDKTNGVENILNLQELIINAIVRTNFQKPILRCFPTTARYDRGVFHPNYFCEITLSGTNIKD